jgi:hypothetical protein
MKYVKSDKGYSPVRDSAESDTYDRMMMAKMKVALANAYSSGNKAAIRMTMPNPKSIMFKDEDGFMGEGTHYMTSMGNYVVPMIQEGPDGKLFYNKNASPEDPEAIRFDTPEEAEYFAKNYKKIAPMMKSAKFN